MRVIRCKREVVLEGPSHCRRDMGLRVIHTVGEIWEGGPFPLSERGGNECNSHCKRSGVGRSSTLCGGESLHTVGETWC